MSAHCQAIGRHGAGLIRNGMRDSDPLQRRLAGVCGYRHAPPRRSTPPRRRAGSSTCSATKPARAARAPRLTAWELAQQGISHQVIADNAAGHLMQRGEIDLVIVGSDRTLGRTGEVANKIGTYTKAVLAQRHGIPFYVAIPLSTIDWNLKSRHRHPHRGTARARKCWAPGARWTRRSRADATPTCAWPTRPAARATRASTSPRPNSITGIITPVGIFKPKQLMANRRRLSAAS